LKKVYIKTFGCRTNLYDSQVMMSSLINEYKLVEDEKEADIVIINSCTVTNGADSNVRNYISKLEKTTKPKIYLTGCGARTKGEELLKSGRVEGVFGQSEKKKVNKLLERKEKFFEIGDLEFIDEAVVGEFIGKSRAFIKIQEGCNFNCSYCIIPYVRGKARSLDEKRILEQISKLASNGFGEFILTGTNLGSYGVDTSSSLAKLLKKISYIRGVRRIRLGSIEPIQITDEFKEILDEPWLEKHLHIAIQHTSKEMLKLMNRRNVYNQDVELFEFLANKGFAIGTDFITGHPGESESIWNEAIKNFKKLPLTHIHAFTYSKRDGTKSAILPNQVSNKIAKQRLHEIESIIKEKNYNFRKNNKEALQVLIEEKKDDYYVGYDQFFNKILVKSDDDLVGNWLEINEYEVKEEANFAKF